MSFDPKKHMMSLKGKEYLPVAARLIWFRQDHPDWSIITSPVELNLEKQYAIFSASILNADGKIIATGTKMETVKDFGDFLEKAETGSVGRALAMCGYGTQFAPEFSEGARFADAPQGPRLVSRPPMSGGNNGGFNNRPMQPRPQNGNGNGSGMGEPRPPMPMTAPDDRAFDAAPPERERQPERPAPQERSPPVSPANGAARPQNAEAPTVANGAARVQRVREPEPDYTDPGGEGELDNPDDLFADDAAPMPPAPLRQSEPERNTMPPVVLGGDKPNPLAANPTCSFPGCTMRLTSGQVTLSLQKFGKPLCIMHQKDAAAVGTPHPANAL